ncbi:hypothetical protein E4T56_gene7029 [Termitomyces sp. T112]|nr:hypothetical protein E4T56_gene7029 [Termitomyces sp. T112]
MLPLPKEASTNTTPTDLQTLGSVRNITDGTEDGPCKLTTGTTLPRGSAAKLLGTPSSDGLRPKDKPCPATPTIVKKDPCHPATCIGIKAGPLEDPAPPTSHTNKKLKLRPPQTHVKDLEVHPLEPAQHTSPLQTEENPYTLGPRPRESNPATPPKNATELCRKTSNIPTEPWNSSYSALLRPDNPGAN